MKNLLDKETMTRYAKARFAAYAQILGFQETLEAFKADPQGQKDNLDESIKGIHKLVDSVTNDLDNKQQSSKGRDAISATLAAAKLDEREVDQVLLEKFSEFEQNQRNTIEKITRLEKTFKEEQTQQNLSQSNLRLVTSLTPAREGSRSCWKRGDFSDSDIMEGYDARRPITDAIIESVENNNATILFGDGYYGKSVILRRVMFEEIERGYAVAFGDGVEANANQLFYLLDRISKDYTKLLLIADNVHRSGGEAIFAAFNRMEPGKIRFLLAARENELDRNKPEIDRAFENILPEAQYTVSFDLADALLFMRQAINVTYEIDTTETDIKFAVGLYQYSEGDPFMFNLGIRYYLSEGKKTYEDFVALDIKEKIKQYDNMTAPFIPAVILF